MSGLTIKNSNEMLVFSWCKINMTINMMFSEKCFNALGD